MKKTVLCLLSVVSAAICWLPITPAKAQTKQEDHDRLKFVLVLTRHGVRSPTWTNERLDEDSAQPWPKWPVAPGLLTPHGKQLMSLFGAYYRAEFAEQGLLSTNGCADVDRIYIRADTDERTLESGRGLADGMMPGCTVEIHSLGAGNKDALFHTSGQTAGSNPKLAFSALAGRIGNNPGALLPAYQMPLESMQQILLPCTETPCTTGGKKNLLTIHASLAAGSDDHQVELKGPLTTAATFAENFQLEYLEGMPQAEVGWGRVNEATMRELMAIHSASSDIVQRTPYIARVQASNLLVHILSTLDQAEQGKPVAGSIGTPDDRVVFLVGHDTNIANIATLLDAHWLVNGYQRDDAAPGGALVFELWQRQGRPDVLRAYYTVQSPEQMRHAVPLSLNTPPSKAMIFLPGCSRAEEGAPCEWIKFRGIIARLVDGKDTSRENRLEK